MAPIWNVNSVLPVNYQVKMIDNIFSIDNPTLLTGGTQECSNILRRVVVVDEKVYQLYGKKIRDYLNFHSVNYKIISLSTSELTKTIDAVLHVVQAIDEFEVTRRQEPVIAIGGGVLLDIVGLAVSLYRRSTRWVRIPTTLIGLVDAGVGAKTGINFGHHKNRIGTYFPC